jgi:hypothetical protein
MKKEMLKKIITVATTTSIMMTTLVLMPKFAYAQDPTVEPGPVTDPGATIVDPGSTPEPEPTPEPDPIPDPEFDPTIDNWSLKISGKQGKGSEIETRKGYTFTKRGDVTITGYVFYIKYIPRSLGILLASVTRERDYVGNLLPTPASPVERLKWRSSDAYTDKVWDWRDTVPGPLFLTNQWVMKASNSPGRSSEPLSYFYVLLTGTAYRHGDTSNKLESLPLWEKKADKTNTHLYTEVLSGKPQISGPYTQDNSTEHRASK